MGRNSENQKRNEGREGKKALERRKEEGRRGKGRRRRERWKRGEMEEGEMKEEIERREERENRHREMVVETAKWWRGVGEWRKCTVTSPRPTHSE